MEIFFVCLLVFTLFTQQSQWLHYLLKMCLHCHLCTLTIKLTYLESTVNNNYCKDAEAFLVGLDKCKQPYIWCLTVKPIKLIKAVKITLKSHFQCKYIINQVLKTVTSQWKNHFLFIFACQKHRTQTPSWGMKIDRKHTVICTAKRPLCSSQAASLEHTSLMISSRASTISLHICVSVGSVLGSRYDKRQFTTISALKICLTCICKNMYLFTGCLLTLRKAMKSS